MHVFLPERSHMIIRFTINPTAAIQQMRKESLS